VTFKHVSQKDKDQIESDEVDSDRDFNTGESVRIPSVIKTDDFTIWYTSQLTSGVVSRSTMYTATDAKDDIESGASTRYRPFSMQRKTRPIRASIAR
jgi:hypothetical protein